MNEATISRTVRITNNRPLPRTGIFAACARDELRRLSRCGDLIEVDAGVVVQDPQRLQWVYVLFDGSLGVTSGDMAYVVMGGGAIGLRSALLGDPPLVSITALANTRLYVARATEFAALARSLKGLAFGIARHLALETREP